MKGKIKDEKKKWNKQRTEKIMMNFGVRGWFFRDKKLKGEKGWTRNFKKQVENKKDYFTRFCQKKKQEKRKKSEKWQIEKKQKMSFPRLKKQHFFRYITTGKQKCENWRNHFSRHRKTRQNKKSKCKTCPTK